MKNWYFCTGRHQLSAISKQLHAMLAGDQPAAQCLPGWFGICLSGGWWL